MVRIDVVYQGDLRCEATHGPSGRTLLTDPPLDNEGRGESFSPTDLVATALGSCMLTIMGIVARRHGWDISGSVAEVEKGMIAEPRRIGSLTVHIRVPADLDEKARKTLEKAALTCPVHKSLHPDTDLPVHFHWASSQVAS